MEIPKKINQEFNKLSSQQKSPKSKKPKWAYALEFGEYSDEIVRKNAIKLQNKPLQ